jgi:hypothetical protein
MKAVFEAVNAMQAAGIIGRYAIGGAVGATFYLEPAATLDVDIFVTLPQHGTLLTLSPLYDFIKARGGSVQSEYVVLDDWPVQFLPAADALDEEALQSAVQTEVDGVPTWVIAEHLAAIALRTGRAKDHNRVLQFIEQNVLDRNKLQEILVRYNLLPKWQRFEKRYLEDGHDQP